MDYVLSQQIEWDHIRVFLGVTDLYNQHGPSDSRSPDPYSEIRNVWYTHLASSEKMQAMFVADDRTNVLGFACVHPLKQDPNYDILQQMMHGRADLVPTETVVLSHLLVGESFRRRKIGTQLFRASLQLAARWGYKKYVMWHPTMSRNIIDFAIANNIDLDSVPLDRARGGIGIPFSLSIYLFGNIEQHI